MAAANQTYNGYRNYQTWNVVLWIQNDEGLYNLARECEDYAAFQETMREFGTMETPDHVAYNDSGLDIDALDELISDLRGEE